MKQFKYIAVIAATIGSCFGSGITDTFANGVLASGSTLTDSDIYVKTTAGATSVAALTLPASAKVHFQDPGGPAGGTPSSAAFTITALTCTGGGTINIEGPFTGGSLVITSLLKTGPGALYFDLWNVTSAFDIGGFTPSGGAAASDVYIRLRNAADLGVVITLPATALAGATINTVASATATLAGITTLPVMTGAGNVTLPNTAPILATAAKVSGLSGGRLIAGGVTTALQFS